MKAAAEPPNDTSIREALAWAVRCFSSLITDTPRLDAELLLAHTLNWNRTRLHTYPERVLSQQERLDFKALTRRHALGEPLAYILGSREFFGLDFLVDKEVLIPRPETELLVEKARAWIQTRASETGGLAAADIGTGSGAIAISLALECPRLTIYATDISPGALQIAARNADRHGVAGRVQMLHGNLLEPLPKAVHLIVANLPYVSEAEMAQLPPHIANFEPRLALEGGPDGLALIERLLAQASAHLRPQGLILLEIGAAQGQAAQNCGRRHFPQAQIQIVQDHGLRDRLLVIQT
ncbi:MAG: protein-(glutamine-N5) methyltransferase, release factor-specific [Anaerolineaceae bacterium 4572_32.1]|nr:MAG: protein-(glutamine-N5) methyltransferase, release factor-specific [Anaerolineaceae bacterium 4572_32.1]